MPGVWGNVMSFIGGPRACIGYRFALVECVELSSRDIIGPDYSVSVSGRKLYFLRL